MVFSPSKTSALSSVLHGGRAHYTPLNSVRASRPLRPRRAPAASCPLDPGPSERGQVIPHCGFGVQLPEKEQCPGPF